MTLTPRSLGSLLLTAPYPLSAIGVYNAADYGASVTGTSAANKIAIDAALAAASAAGGGIVLLPVAPSTQPLLTDGAHDLGVGVEVWGHGTTGTVVLNRGSSYTFRLSNQTSGQESPALRRLSVIGSNGTYSAVASAIGVQVSNGLKATLEDLSISGFTAASSIGLQFLNRNSSTNLCEHTEARQLAVINCTTLIQFLSQSGAGQSFGYTNLRNLYLQIYASQTAIDVGGTGPVVALLYNSLIEGSLHYTGSNGIGIKVTATGSVWQGTRIYLAGEVLSGSSLTRISYAGPFFATGKFFIASATVSDTQSGGGSIDFPEDPYSDAELPAASRSIASANFGMTAPPGSSLYTVTGTTQISQVLGGWSGRLLTLVFAGALTVKDGISNLQLAGDFVTTANDTLTLMHENGTWYEVARSVN